ncbi:MAG: hypothetical protein RJQ04_03945 [Longimicrobiales bacterium]
MTRTAAVLFLLWGLVHVAGGAVMLATLGDGAEAYLRTVATVDPSAAALTPPAGSPAVAILGFHAWNILWVGLCVSAIALTLNLRGSRAGYWINLALVSGADVGLILFLVLPGVMTWGTAAPGLGLWLPAAAAGFVALRTRTPAGDPR